MKSVKNYEEVYERILNESTDMKKENCDLKSRIYNINRECVRAIGEFGVPMTKENQRIIGNLREILRMCDIKYDDIPY
jgi:hypothetical protein